MKLSRAARAAEVSATAALCNGGKLVIYKGAVPISADTAVNAADVLGELMFNNPAFNTTVTDDGSVARMTANTVSPDTSTNADGTATFFRIYKSDNTTCVIQGTISTAGGGGDMIISNTAITTGGTITVNSLSYGRPE